jgi:tetrahydromethanopterin S-methyltransferase subunit B
MATAQKKPIFVSAPLFEEVEDMSHILEDIKNSSSPSDEL